MLNIDKNKIPEEDWFCDMQNNLYLDVLYRGGRLYDINTKKEIKVRENAYLRISTSVNSLNEEQKDIYTERREKKILNVGSELVFKLRIDGRIRIFVVKIQEDLVMEIKGHSFGKLKDCRCEVTSMDIEMTKVIANSLNQAFTKTSVLVRPNNSTHNCNVFKVFYYDGNKLDKLR